MSGLVFYVVLWAIGLGRCEPLLPSIAGKLNKVIFVYPTGAQSERDLSVCPKNSACNVIHKRFWLPPLVERLCRCPLRQECLWTWSEEAENHTTTLDNRSQIKFCSDLTELPACTLKKSAIRVVTKVSNSKVSGATGSATAPTAGTTMGTKQKGSQRAVKQAEPRNVTSFCQCPEPHYWKIRANWTKYDEETDSMHQYYTCTKLKKCTSMEFCGYIRTDTYSNFYRCSCPKGHMCISKSKTLHRIEELLYNGYGYKASCHPVKN